MRGGASGKGGSPGKGGTGGGTGGSSVGGTGGDQITQGGQGDGTGGSTGGTGGDTAPSDPSVTRLQGDVTKLDVLLVVDNSLGMAEKQGHLAQGMRTLLERFTNPPCVDKTGAVTGAADDNGLCEVGAPVTPQVRDIHFGVITSSLGDHGSHDVCSPEQNQANINAGGPSANYDDKAQLIGSVRPGMSDFLSFSPGDDALDFASQAAQAVLAAGGQGCGYEAPLEAWYRFLIDPEPVASMDNNDRTSVRGPVNQVLLAQRAAFLRPDSAVVIAMITDENDCSITDENNNQGWLVGYKGGVGNLSWHMPRATSACSVDPNDRCCRLCGQPVDGCPDYSTDAACLEGSYLSLNEDSINLRCAQQMKRFGVDLLYPTTRYGAGLLSPMIDPRMDGNMVPNPLFGAGPNGLPMRDPSMVYLAGVVGVPWQDVVTDDTLGGGDFKYQTASELSANGRWGVMLGIPEANVAPTDPFMVESIDPRPSGARHPLIDTAIGAPASATALNPINGHEQAVLPQRDDLQFACIYPLEHPVSPAECGANADECDCNADESYKNSPLCQGATPNADGTEVYGKAYPGVRELQVLELYGANSIVASVCPRYNTSDDPPNDAGYGYNSALAAIADRASEALAYRCFPPRLPVGGDGRLAARLIEARPSLDPCSCDPAEGRLVPDTSVTSHLPAIEAQLQNLGLDPATECLCELEQLSGSQQADCFWNAEPTASEHGFCYVDGDNGLANPAFWQGCPANMPRRIRYFGDGVPAANALTFLVEGLTPAPP